MMRCVVTLLAVVFLLAPAFCQSVTPAASTSSQPILKLGGAVPTPLSLTQEEWARLPRATASMVVKENGPLQKFEGVLLSTLLEGAGVPKGAKLHGKFLLMYVTARATDGYRALFSISELDAETGSTTGVLVADTVDGKPLDAHNGPLRLIIPSDKRPERSVCMLDSITVSALE